MYVGRDFDPADPAESQTFGFDYVNDLASGDTIRAAAVALTVQQGTDPTPSARLIGGVSTTSNTAIQRIANLLAGVTYTLQIVVTTSQGDTLSLYSHIECRAVY